MLRTNLKLFSLTAFLFFIVFVSCDNELSAQEEGTHYNVLPEVKPVEIKLAEPFNSPDKEYSGLAVFQNKLVLLPQYFFGLDKDTVGYLYTIDFSRITQYLNGSDTTPIRPDSIRAIGNGLQRFNRSGSGYEAIVFEGNNVFLAIEDIGVPTKTYIVKGTYDENDNSIFFDDATLTELPQQTNVRNYGYETLVKYGENIISINELNGVNNVSQPKAFEYDENLSMIKSFGLPHIEYRITDATYVENNEFWAINYFWPGDSDLTRPGEDKIAEKYGIGEHQSTEKGIERILKFKIVGDSLIVASAPIYIYPDEAQSSNWEGIAKFGNGFILVTDTYPRTRLVYVEP